MTMRKNPNKSELMAEKNEWQEAMTTRENIIFS